MFRQFNRFRSTARLSNNKFNENYVNKLSDYYIELIKNYNETSTKVIKNYKESTNQLIYFSMTGFGAFLAVIKQDIDKKFESIDKKFEEIKTDNKKFRDEIKELISSKRG